MSWLDGPIAGIDFESTSVDIETARIVTTSIFLSGRGCKSWLIAPGIPIPEAAIAVHGVTDEMAAEGLDPVVGLVEIDSALQYVWSLGAPVAAHNAVYDLSLLDRELRRHLGRPLEVTGPVLDSLVLDKAVDPYRKGSRRLADACTHWGVPVVEADLHTSSGDVVAAVELAQMIVRNSELYDTGSPDDMPRKLAEFSLRKLHQIQVEAYAQQRNSFNSWLTRQGKTPDDDNTVWPVKPYGKVE